MSRLFSPERWIRQPEKASGILTLVAMLVAFAMVNSSWRSFYDLVHHLPVALRVGDWLIERPLILWINEGLMVFFFLLVAMEIKREILQGHLASRAKVMLPVIAAVGGMVAPALIYLAVTWGNPLALRGWAIPTATDTVLALAALHVLGARVPASVKAFLTALAIFDDLGAIIIIATFFTKSVSTAAVLIAAIALLGLILMNRLGVTRISAYVLAGVALWAAVLASGVHATLAGFLIGLTIPLRGKRPQDAPLISAEKGLRPWVALCVVPVFAFFNSGVHLTAQSMGVISVSVVWGAALALVLGKPLGILCAGWVAVRSGIAKLPTNASWGHIGGAATLAGIGFTMSLFFTGLAFGTRDALALSATVGVLTGSIISAILGLGLIALTTVHGNTSLSKVDGCSDVGRIP